MTRDTIEGFMFGLGAGFLIAHFLKAPEELHEHTRDNRREGELSVEGSERLLRPISAASGSEKCFRTAS